MLKCGYIYILILRSQDIVFQNPYNQITPAQNPLTAVSLLTSAYEQRRSEEGSGEADSGFDISAVGQKPNFSATLKFTIGYDTAKSYDLKFCRRFTSRGRCYEHHPRSVTKAIGS